MRSIILTLLIAGTAAPALAQDRGPFGLRQRDRAAQSSDEGGQSPRPQRAERQRPSAQDSGGEYVRPQRVERQQGAREAVREQRVFERRERASQRDMQIPVRSTAPANVEAQRPLRTHRGGSMIDRMVEMRRAPNADAVLAHPPTATPSQIETRHSRSDRQWSNHWRSDSRYDWRRHRDRNRSVFRFGNYWDPYGYNYRRFSIGFNLWPSYYQSSYWLNDPWMYRLPPAYGPYRWVRYWDDALLVNIYTGQVVDVVHNFFW